MEAGSNVIIFKLKLYVKIKKKTPKPSTEDWGDGSVYNLSMRTQAWIPHTHINPMCCHGSLTSELGMERLHSGAH